MIKTKFEKLSSKQSLKYKKTKTKPFSDLEDRSLYFGKRIVKMCKSLPNNYVNTELGRQCLRSGTSTGANYREANETDTKKDFKHRIRIAKKEAKETVYWLQLIIEANPEIKDRILPLLEESIELMKILGSIYEKTLDRNKI